MAELDADAAMPELVTAQSANAELAMHPNPNFRQTAAPDALAFARNRGFGILTVADAEGVMAAHVPFVLDKDGNEAEMHLVRSNPIARALAAGPARALLIVSGPDAYISPDWYGIDDQVPTWNYVAVHLSGSLVLEEATGMRGHLDRIAAHFEPMLAPKRPWTAEKMREETLAKLMRGIVPARLSVETVESTFKLNQNKTPEARLGAANSLEPGSPGQEVAEIARLMRALD